ncbi:carbohydrate ABC transporter membrane protein 2 (CUT1 family) [Promicromonospora sp. AC04]|uniref:carbohydrate ABC transporter permease n=1 Tax=Promicromonospora sp. AC04 TaxID=2135723 RepID=UPI000D368C78|nr:carbohydrate ABC transporter permease [Promicromonospora sp. AC04]PUB29759.1 carbohydrate ABC transporter membrane protein 2 (CUT1 family) [Promicromonospora sp. AC04]
MTATTAPRLADPAARRRRSPRVAGYVTMIFATVVVGAPLLWLALASLKAPDELYQLPLQWLPARPDLDNYAQAASAIPLGRLLANSIGLTVVGAGLKVVLGLCCAYALVFLDFPFRKAVFGLVIVTLMIPPQITIIPNYTLVASLGWLNTYQGILVPGLASAFGTFLFRQHFLTLPASILEAAELDGAGHWRKLWRFVVPMSTPTLAAVALVSVVTEWNDYLWPFLVVDHPETMTLPVGLTLLQNTDGMSDWGVLLAATVVVTLPILLVFLVLQRRLVDGLTAGAVTG